MRFFFLKASGSKRAPAARRRISFFSQRFRILSFVLSQFSAFNYLSEFSTGSHRLVRGTEVGMGELCRERGEEKEESWAEARHRHTPIRALDGFFLFRRVRVKTVAEERSRERGKATKRRDCRVEEGRKARLNAPPLARETRESGKEWRTTSSFFFLRFCFFTLFEYFKK